MPGVMVSKMEDFSRLREKYKSQRHFQDETHIALSDPIEEIIQSYEDVGVPCLKLDFALLFRGEFEGNGCERFEKGKHVAS